MVHDLFDWLVFLLKGLHLHLIRILFYNFVLFLMILSDFSNKIILVSSNKFQSFPPFQLYGILLEALVLLLFKYLIEVSCESS